MPASPLRRKRRPTLDGITAEDLRRARGQLGLTLAELAEHAGVSSRTLASWERGDVEPSVVPLGRLTRYLRSQGVTLGGTDDRGAEGVLSAIRDDPVLPQRVKDAMIVLAERYYPPQ